MTKSNFLYIILLTVAASCEKVINVDLKNADPKIVIEGIIDNSGNPAKVIISKSVPFSNANAYPPVTGATVKITDDLGNNFTLTEGPSGTYTNTSLIGTPGRTYVLNAIVNGQAYTATSKMPQPVNFDSLAQDEITFSALTIFADALFIDPPGFGNQYQFIETINGKRNKTIFILDDMYQDGGTINNELIDEEAKIKKNDIVQVEMRCIDKNIYRYMKGLQDIEMGGTVPANPESNIDNGALGYFSAHTSQKKTIIIH